MILYSCVICVSLALIMLLNHFFSIPIFNFSDYYIVMSTLTTFVAVVLLDGITAFSVHSFPEKRINPLAEVFLVNKKERKFYEKLGVKSWKSYLPDLGAIVNFRKGKISQPRDKEYIYKYMVESCYGSLGHILSVFVAFAVIFLYPIQYALCFAIPVCLVNGILNLLPFIALRYNRATLAVLYKRLLRTEKIAQDKEQGSDI